jgi:uncharacterized membrane protein YidH (DUF202 family)
VSHRFQLKRLLSRLTPSGTVAPSADRQAINQSRKRLIALLILFDAVLIAATLLSFQQAELIEEEVTLLQTKEVTDILNQDQVFTTTTAITEIIPYGSVP